MNVELTKKGLINAYKNTFGNITEASKLVGVSRTTFYNWLKEDAEFAQAIKEVEPEEQFLDLCEMKLTEKIGAGDTIAILFALKTKGKKRGYIEKVEHGFTNKDGEDSLPFSINLDSGCKEIEK